MTMTYWAFLGPPAPDGFGRPRAKSPTSPAHSAAFSLGAFTKKPEADSLQNLQKCAESYQLNPSFL